MPTPRLLLIHPLRVIAVCLPLLAACGQTQEVAQDAASDQDTLDAILGFEAKAQDVPIVVEDLGPQNDAVTDTQQDTGPQSDVLAVNAQTAPSVKLGTTMALKVVVDHNVGVDGAPKSLEVVTFWVDGNEVAVGVTLAPTAKGQAPIAIWQTGNAGDYLIAGVRPGTAKLVVKVDGIAAEAVSVDVVWPDGLFIGGSTPAVTGQAPAKRVDEVAPDTVKIVGQLFAPGGVDAALRFPTTAKNGDSFDFGSAPAKGSLSINLTIVSPTSENFPASAVFGRLWIDQADKGFFKGTFLGKTTDQSPVVGAFVIERDGNFGIDVLDEATLVEASADVLPDSDLHASRVSVNAIGDGKALLTWRRIKNVTQAEIARWIIDAKTGEAVKTLPPLVSGNVGPWQMQPDPAQDPVFGSVTAGVSNKKILVAWEGKNGMNSFSAPAPSGVWMRAMDSDGTLSTSGVFADGKPIALSDDVCNGSCHPQILTLPNASFLVIWSPTTGGIRARRIDGAFGFKETNPLQLVAPPATAASASVLDSTLGLMWRDPVQGAFMKVYTINPGALSSSAQEIQIGQTVANAPMPGLGIFSGNAPGFLSYAIDGIPATTLKMRRIGFDNSPVVGEITVDQAIGAIRVAAGESPQVVVLQQDADVKSTTPLRLRKFSTQSPIDGGTQLGATIALGAKSAVPLVPALCYVPETDVYIAAWAGDFKSEGVYFQRFR